MNWKTITTVVLLSLLVAFGLTAVQTTIEQRPLNNKGLTAGASFGDGLPTVDNDGRPPFHGEMFTVRTDGADALVRVFNDSTSSWDTVPMLENTNTWTVANTFDGSVTLGSDEEDIITANAPVSHMIWRDDFCGIGVLQNDGTVESGVDTEINDIFTLASGKYYQFVEQTATLSLARNINTAAAGCGLAVSGDVTANEGQEIRFVADALGSVHTVDSATDEFYFEISVTIADISAVDGDFAFGLKQPATQLNPPQHDGEDTYFILTLSDNAGDADFECDVDAGGQTNDTASFTWADAATHTVRFEIDGAGYNAYVDDSATAETLTNCNDSGNNDFTDLDKVLPWFYYTQGAEGAATGVVINYVEWGYGVK